MIHSYICHLALKHSSQVDAIYAAQNCIKDIRTWMTVDKMKLKGDKTEFIVISIREAITTHINKPCKSILYHLHNIRRNRKFCPWYRL